MRKKLQQADTLQLVRCAVYTRKSTDEGLAQDFNSLDAQREACQAYVLSQQGLGWACLPDRYDDGGFTGANTERPALQRLLRDINAGKVDCVVVYKVDRLSRSLLDFAGLMKTFEEKGVAFCSVTQQMNTGSSMGRLMLNVLLSFAQFEREIISERTRDKIAATRRKGKWCGGRPSLGYDLKEGKLIVNEDEAIRVRGIFDLYLEHQSLLPVVRDLEERQWTTKVHTNKNGNQTGGTLFNKTTLHFTLTNPIYIGKVRYKDEVHQGEHEAIIDQEVWNKTQRILQRNAATGGSDSRNKYGFLLKGLLRCDACDKAMTPSFTTKRGDRRYRYYVCGNATKHGWDKCPSKSIPAGQIEDLVVERIKCVGEDPTVLHQTLAEARQQDEARLAELQVERKQIERDLRQGHQELRELSGRASAYESEPVIDRLAELQERLGHLEQRALKVKDHLHALRTRAIDEDEAAEALRLFDPLWQELTPQERARIIHLLVEQVGYDGRDGTPRIAFHASGIQTLTQEILDQQQEESA